MRLTKPNLPKLVLPAGRLEIIVFDDAMPGFGVRIRAGGKRTWIVQYRLGAKQRRLSLGSIEKLDADDARRRAKSVFAKVQLGQDPAIEKSEAVAQASTTVGSVADIYIDRHAEKRRKPKGLSETKNYLQGHWAPIREIPLQKLRLQTIAARLHEIGRDHGPYAANRARAALSSMFSWAIGEGLCDLNPVIGTNKAEEKKRERVLNEEELADVWRHAGDGEHGMIVKLLALTAQRREEVGGMLWSEIDLRRKAWVIRSDRTKNGLPHLVPLSEPVVDLLEGIPRREGRDLVFGSGKGSFSGWSKAKQTLDERIAYQKKSRGSSGDAKPWRLHDLRRTAATNMGELGVLPHVVEAVLNHISGSKAGVAGVYNLATYAAEKRAALDLWAARLKEIVGGVR